MNIRTKLLAAFAALGLVSTGVTGWLAYIVARTSLERSTFERLTSVREAKRNQVRQWFEDRQRLLLEAAEDPALDAALSRLVVRHGFRAAVLADTGGGRVLRSSQAAGSRTACAATALPAGPDLARAVRLAMSLRGTDGCVLADMAASPSPQEAPSLLLAAPLRASPPDAGGHPDAVLVACMPIDALNAVMTSGSNWREAGLGESGETYIVGGDFLMRSDSRFFIQEPDRYFRLLRERGTDTTVLHRIAAHASTVLLQDTRTEATEAALRGESGTRIIDDYRGVQVVSSYAPLALPGVRWVILAEIDTQEAFRSIAALRERLVLAGLITLLAGLAAAAAVARSIARPILSLARTTEQFGAGDLARRAEIASRDEIGALAATFNAMADSIGRNTESLRNLSAHLQSVREDERKGVAREIHDELGQALTTLKLELRLLRDDMEKPSPDPAARIAMMNDIIDATIRSVKRLITDLRPRLLDDLGLVAAIEWQAEDFTRRTGIACSVRVHPPDLQPEPERSVAIFRICQEALTNAARHSAADAVTIEVRMDHERIVLDVRDNGCGITRAAAESPTSFGLLGITERAAYWGGSVSIDGVPGQGTRLRVSLPNTRGAS